MNSNKPVIQEENREKDYLTIEICADKDEYFRANMYYMRKYFGLREIILLALLLGIGIGLYFLSGTIAMLIMFGICVVIIFIAFLLFVATGKGGYKIDVIKKGVVRQKLEFRDNAIVVTNYNSDGKALFEETHFYERLDKIAVRKNVIYIYAQAAVFYYIKADKFDTETRQKIVNILQEHVPPQTFRMKKTYRKYPKKKKLTLDDDEA